MEYCDKIVLRVGSHIAAQLPPDLDTSTRWRPVNTSRADQPRHRFCHVAVAYSDSMYVFGG